MLNRILLLIALGVFCAGAYFFTRWQMDASINQQRLRVLAARYDTLEAQYAEAVRKTAITELLVENGQLHVVIRTVKGPLQRFATPFDPEQEIYVDYVVLNGRLWIRRIFDSQTPPEKALVLDHDLAGIDWESEEFTYGKAVYRRLSEGRWVVTVTGNGALGLAKVNDRVDHNLAHAPSIDQFETAPVTE